ncbi:MAG TPA: V-type ATP synthase subunit F [Ruminococcaceae bacterium]|nr:V-type ATP synthase subunit F [Oscillospiraceae bacterium]
MLKVAVIGDADSVKGFLALGLEVYETSDSGEAKKLLHRLAGGNYAVIYITEALFSGMTEEISALADQRTPAVIPILGVFGNTGIGARHVSQSVERAVGSDIISD